MERHFGEGTMIENKDKIARLNLPKSQPDVKIMIWETYKTKLQPGLVDVTFYQAEQRRLSWFLRGPDY